MLPQQCPSAERSSFDGGSQLNGGQARRPQTLMPTSVDLRKSQNLVLTIHKDSAGYGMKVSGDKPVYVESVKADGAAYKAGLQEGDMILKVNGTSVRLSTHLDVVQLIKASATVELTVQRNYQIPSLQHQHQFHQQHHHHPPQRPTSISVVTPSTPLTQRGGITAPVPVDHVKRREMEVSKMQTLSLMLDQEKKNLVNLIENNQNPNDIAKAEANIRTLQDQLRHVCKEDAPKHILIQKPIIIPPQPSSSSIPLSSSLSSSLSTTSIVCTATTTTTTTTSLNPPFLSRFPRSLSSLSLGTKKKSTTEKEFISPSTTVTTTPSSTPRTGPNIYTDILPSQQSQYQQSPTKKKKFSNETIGNSGGDLLSINLGNNFISDTPPPLPQRNIPRRISDQMIGGPAGFADDRLFRTNVQISDLDNSIVSPVSNNNNNNNNNSNNNSKSNKKKNSVSNVTTTPTTTPKSSIITSISGGGGGGGGKGKKRFKGKTKALSDPKMSSQIFLQMEKSQEESDYNKPPPLPPRPAGMFDDKVLLSSSKSDNTSNTRALPNSIDTCMNYPLISTSTAVRDNLTAGGYPKTSKSNQQQRSSLSSILAPNVTITSTSNIANNTAITTSTITATTTTTTTDNVINNHIALGISPQQQQQQTNHLQQHRRIGSSPEHLQTYERELLGDRKLKSSSGSWELLEKDNEITPPGTPPPPYKICSSRHDITDNVKLGLTPSIECSDLKYNPSPLTLPPSSTQHNLLTAAQTNVVQRSILSMEDDEMLEDRELAVNEDHGPFRSVSHLLEQENLVYLGVFLNFVLSNSDPSPLLFYLITGLYRDGSSVKDMRKWSYEIHSTFLVPRAPLLWYGVDESLAREVDDVLQHEYDKGEILRKVFFKSRCKAKEYIAQQLDDFQVKRTAGLGTMYGPVDTQLHDARGDKVKEQRIYEEILLPKLQQLVDDVDREQPSECPKKSALCSALSTVIHRIFITKSNPGSLVDRVHHFVSREKSFKRRLMGKSRKSIVRGHHLVLKQYYEVTHCNHCQNIIWGVSPQGYRCSDCELNIHRGCVPILEENCPGPVPSKRKDQHNDNKMTKFIEKIRPTQIFNPDRSRRLDDESGPEDIFPVDRPTSTSIVRQASDRRTDTSNNSSLVTAGGNSSNDINTSQSLDVDTDLPNIETDNQDLKTKSAPVSINRSESYKGLSHKRSRTNRRKTSDPSLTRSNDEQSQHQQHNVAGGGELGGISNANFTASSSSSLSSSPSTSLETIGAPSTSTVHGTINVAREWIDSDEETFDLEIDWCSHVPPDILQTLSDKEKKRQEIINEIYQTERSHVRTLRLLEGVFMRPLQESGVLSADYLTLLFPSALLTLKDLHISFEQQLKQRRIDHGSIVRNIGDLLLVLFDGRSGEELKENAAQFCARQQIALEALKEKRRKDENLQKLLTKAESHKACRRLQLKDLLPTAMQRLTKYPLLFENLLQITQLVEPNNEVEAQSVRKALELSKGILDYVNQTVRMAEHAYKLQMIQKKLDKSNYEKEASNEFKNLDLTQHKLIHDGPLIMKKNPHVQLHGLLFESMMVLLQKQDDKYILKYHSSPGVGGAEGKNLEVRFNPITKITIILVRQSAVDKNSFFLINTSVSQMLELKAPSSSECKTWFNRISSVADMYKLRTRSAGNQDGTESPSILCGGLYNSMVSPSTSSSMHKHNLETSVERELNASNNIPTTISSTIRERDDMDDGEYDDAEDGDADEDEDDGDDNDDDDDAAADDNGGDEDDDDNEEHKNNNNADGMVTTNDEKYMDNVKNKDNENDANVKLTLKSNGDGLIDNNKQHNNNNKDDNLTNNNSNNTRILTQQSSLVAPGEVHVSMNPALTAEPILTQSERLKRLDESLRATLAEKQKIVCDMFKVPNEHFIAIADIVGQPEAPKDPSDIVLAAFAQVQSLTETLNEYIKVSTHQQISAVSKSYCDECYRKHQQNIYENYTSINSFGIKNYVSPLLGITNSNNNNNNNSNSSSNINNNSSTTTLATTSTTTISSTTTMTSLTTMTLTTTSDTTIPESIVDASNTIDQQYPQHQVVDDDGYCEIDELGLPTVISHGTTPSNNDNDNNNITAGASNTSNNNIAAAAAALDDNKIMSQNTNSIPKDRRDSINTINNNNLSNNVNNNVDINSDDNVPKSTSTTATTTQTQITPSHEFNTVNFDLPTTTSSSSSSTTTVPILNGNNQQLDTIKTPPPSPSSNAIDRITHAKSIAPSVPCHLIVSHVTTLNLHLSQLLSKLNERDIEREKLRKEVQYLREMLNLMHCRNSTDEQDLPENVSDNRPQDIND